MQKEGESGRNKINQWTRYMTIFITAAQAIGYVRSQIPANGHLMADPYFTVLTTLTLTAGTLFVMWLGEKITDKGIGNGISLIIMVGIIASLPGAIASEFNDKVIGSGGGPIFFIVELVALMAVVMFTILIVQGTRKVAVQYAKRIVG
jgi:preprotein translocase subunit SecY